MKGGTYRRAWKLAQLLWVRELWNTKLSLAQSMSHRIGREPLRFINERGIIQMHHTSVPSVAASCMTISFCVTQGGHVYLCPWVTSRNSRFRLFRIARIRWASLGILRSYTSQGGGHLHCNGTVIVRSAQSGGKQAKEFMMSRWVKHVFTASLSLSSHQMSSYGCESAYRLHFRINSMVSAYSRRGRLFSMHRTRGKFISMTGQMTRAR
jgi:hypothetical protein